MNKLIVILALSLPLAASASNMYSGVTSLDLDRPYQAEMAINQRYQPVPEMEVHQRPRVIDWTPWHVRIGQELLKTWRLVYGQMGNFPLRGKLHQGLMRIYATPNNGLQVTIVQSCGDPQVDEFVRRWYDSIDGDPQLFYMEGTRRQNFSYIAPFNMFGDSSGRLALVETTPTQNDLEYLY